MSSSTAIEKLPTHIPGFDHVSMGGLARGRTTLVSGTAGSAKTVFAAHFLAEGIRCAGESGVFVTFEESVDDLRRNFASFGWDIEQWERDGKWAFVDAAPDPSEESVIVGHFDLGALLARIEHAVQRTGAKRLSMDSLGAVFTQFSDKATVRRELLRIAFALKKTGVTSVLTAERMEDHGEMVRHGVEEFVADNVVILRNTLELQRRRRTLEILKYRGAMHRKGEFPLTILPNEGLVVIPLSAIELTQHSSTARITSGNEELDHMCDGGFFRDSIVLVSGATGTGKTLMATGFMAAGVHADERCMLLAFEESRQQLFRNAAGWGCDFARMEEEGKLKVSCNYPESAELEDHLIAIKRAIDEFKPRRIAVDSLTALERVSSPRGFREFVIALISFVKAREIAGFFTATSSNLLGGESITDSHISTITDSIILLRYVEVHGEMRRGLTVLKMRGSGHDKDIREFTIDGNGMHIGEPFRQVAGILTSSPRQVLGHELDSIRELFKEG